MSQIVLAIISNAGGVGKSTISANLAYHAGMKGLKTTLIDLDPNHSLEDFVGLSKNPDEAKTVVSVFDRDFQGNWPLQPLWDQENIHCIQGHARMEQITESLSSRTRREYVLSKVLKKYSLPDNLIILDCPGTRSLINTNALAAATHLLIPLQLEVKIKTVSELINWCWDRSEELDLDPPPEILGLIPNQYDRSVSMHRQSLEQLPQVAEAIGITTYPEIPDTPYLANASYEGKPLKLYRTGGKFVEEIFAKFDLVVNDLLKYAESISN